MSIREGQLVLRDGSVFEGELIGAVRSNHHVHYAAHWQLRNDAT
jgi:hypothetical protein